VVAQATDAAELSLAGPARSKVPDEGGEVSEMGGRDLCADRQMLQAVRRTGPRQVAPEDLSDSSLLGAGEHDAAIVVEPLRVGQWPGLNCRSSQRWLSPQAECGVFQSHMLSERPSANGVPLAVCVLGTYPLGGFLERPPLAGQGRVCQPRGPAIPMRRSSQILRRASRARSIRGRTVYKSGPAGRIACAMARSSTGAILDNTVELAAPPVLGRECHQGLKGSGHGA
jgi:hypothetical protein